jgi:hypothetical protein
MSSMARAMRWSPSGDAGTADELKTQTGGATLEARVASSS